MVYADLISFHAISLHEQNLIGVSYKIRVCQLYQKKKSKLCTVYHTHPICHYFLFSKIKIATKGKRFNSTSDIEKCILDSVPKIDTDKSFGVFILMK